MLSELHSEIGVLGRRAEELRAAMVALGWGEGDSGR
jgi:hypothetical protein